MNWLRIILAALSFMIVGALWYSPLVLGDVWAELGGMDMNALQPTPWHYLGAASVALVMSIGMAQLFQWVRPASLVHAWKVVAVVWLAFVVTTQFSGVIWGGYPLKIFLIDIGCVLVNVLVMAPILYQRKR
ncbi:MAG: DUF1761 domain-containing protein [Chlamydiales bacterium]|nr:DUF1761 domain-containing protein [Chlamydiales bacterium]